MPLMKEERAELVDDFQRAVNRTMDGLDDLAKIARKLGLSEAAEQLAEAGKLMDKAAVKVEAKAAADTKADPPGGTAAPPASGGARQPPPPAGEGGAKPQAQDDGGAPGEEPSPEGGREKLAGEARKTRARGEAAGRRHGYLFDRGAK